jgi:serine/threonine protein kinase
MGSCASKNGQDTSSVLSIRKFKTLNVIGRGGFGKVHIVERNGKQYAMKEMLKARVMHKDSVESVLKELEFLRRIDQSDPHSKFIVNVKYAFHDPTHMYLVIDLLNGGDFRFHLLKEKAF